MNAETEERLDGEAQREDERLQAFFDGELDELASETLRRRLEESEVLRARLRRLERMRDAIRRAAEDAGAELGSEDLFASIRGTIEHDRGLGRGYSEAPPAPGLRSIEGGAAGRGGTFALVGIVALAAAALLVFVSIGDEAELGRLRPAPRAREAYADNGAAQVVVEEETPMGSEVLDVDFGASTGTVFAVEGNAGQPLAVVWIDDEMMEP